MLTYNLTRILKARGIDRPFSYLTHAGFSSTFATRVKNGRVSQLNVGLIERLCVTLRCTPNDLMEWVPDPDQELDGTHPLHKIRKSEKIVDLARTLNSIPLEKIQEIDQLINDKLKEDR